MDTLSSYATLGAADRARAELIVVDNDSTDETRDVVRAFSTREPGIRYILEPRAGLSHARNTGIRDSRGDVIVFVDDDVYFEPRWLGALMSVFEKDPNVACAGGRSVPCLEGERPDWLDESVLTMYGCRNYGDEVRRLYEPESPHGVNMAFRRDVFDAVGLFNADLGRKRTSLLSCEESEMFRRVHRARLMVMYTPDAVVYHRISKARLDKKWAMKRSYWQGISDVVMREALEPSSLIVKLKKALRLGGRLVRDCTGGYCLPWRIVRHVRSVPFGRRVIWIELAAMIQAWLAEALRSLWRKREYTVVPAVPNEPSTAIGEGRE